MNERLWKVEQAIAGAPWPWRLRFVPVAIVRFMWWCQGVRREADERVR